MHKEVDSCKLTKGPEQRPIIIIIITPIIEHFMTTTKYSNQYKSLLSKKHYNGAVSELLYFLARVN